MFLNRLFPQRAQQQLSPNWHWPFDTAQSASRQSVTPDSAMRVAAVFACVRVLSETLAQLPWHVYERMPDGTKRLALDHPLSGTLRQPNTWQTPFEFKEMLMGHLALRGNAYAEIVAGERGAASYLIPWHPDRVKVERLVNGKLRYLVKQPDTHTDKPYAQEQVFHLRGLSSDGVAGLSPIKIASEPIGLAMASEKFAAKF